MAKIHATDIRSYLECRRKFKYSNLERLKPQVYEKPDYFEFGTEWHKVMAAHYRKDPNETPLSVINEIINDEHRGKIKVLYDLYVEEYEEKDKYIQPISVEQMITCNFKGLEIEFTMDIWAMDTSKYKSHHLIMDHKSYKSFPNPVTLDLDFQISFYYWAATRAQINVKEFLINVVRKSIPSYPDMLKSGLLSTSATTLANTDYTMFKWAIQTAQHSESMYKDALEFLKQRGSNTFKRYRQKRTPEFLKSFEDSLGYILDEIYSDTSQLRMYPTPSINCPSCPYNMLCRIESENGTIEETKKAMFTIKDEDER